MMKRFTVLLGAVVGFVLIMMLGILLLTVLTVCVGYIVSAVFPLTLFHASLLCSIITSAVILAFTYIKVEDNNESEDDIHDLDDFLSEVKTDWDTQFSAKKRKLKKEKAKLTVFKQPDSNK